MSRPRPAPPRAAALHDDAALRRLGNARQRLVEQRLVRDHARALDPHDAETTASARVVDARRQLVGGEAAEHDRVDRPQRAHASMAMTASGIIGM
jgi:hypothetical protein